MLIAAVVLAAGGSVRMGAPKQTLRFRGVPMLQVVVETLRRSKVDRVVVVLGAHEPEVRKDVSFDEELVVENPDYSSGMSSSIRAGLAAVPDADAALVVLADQPFLAPQTIDILVEAYRVSRSPVVLPVFRGRRGNPVLFDRSLFPEISRLRGDVGAKAVVRAHQADLLEVPVDDAGVVEDIDTPEDYKGTSPDFTR